VFRPSKNVARRVGSSLPVVVPYRAAGNADCRRRRVALPRAERNALSHQDLAGENLHLVRAGIADEIDTVVPGADDGAGADVWRRSTGWLPGRRRQPLPGPVAEVTIISTFDDAVSTNS